MKTKQAISLSQKRPHAPRKAQDKQTKKSSVKKKLGRKRNIPSSS